MKEATITWDEWTILFPSVTGKWVPQVAECETEREADDLWASLTDDRSRCVIRNLEREG